MEICSFFLCAYFLLLERYRNLSLYFVKVYERMCGYYFVFLSKNDDVIY